MKYILFLLIGAIIIAGCTGQVQEKAAKRSVPQVNQVGSVICNDNDCFSNNFRECKPSSFVVKFMEDFSTKNEILGLKDSGCEYKYTILESPDSNTAGKWMTCIVEDYQKYGASNLFSAPSAEQCSGPLVDLQ